MPTSSVRLATGSWKTDVEESQARRHMLSAADESRRAIPYRPPQRCCPCIVATGRQVDDRRCMRQLVCVLNGCCGEKFCRRRRVRWRRGTGTGWWTHELMGGQGPHILVWSGHTVDEVVSQWQAAADRLWLLAAVRSRHRHGISTGSKKQKVFLPRCLIRSNSRRRLPSHSGLCLRVPVAQKVQRAV